MSILLISAGALRLLWLVSSAAIAVLRSPASRAVAAREFMKGRRAYKARIAKEKEAAHVR